jgi:hypothetical protein
MTAQTNTPLPPEPVNRSTLTALKVLFWVALIGFLSWDWVVSPTIDLRNEPPVIAAGSGQAPTGGHCSMAK